MLAARSVRRALLLMLVAGSSLTAQAGPPADGFDLNPALETFARKTAAATRDRNDIQLATAVQEFHDVLAKHQGEEVRLAMAMLSVKPHRVLLDNPILSDKTRYRFVFFAGDVPILPRTQQFDLEAATDQVIVAGVPQPVPVFEKLASISPTAAANLKKGDRVVLTGKLQPLKVDPSGMHSIHLVRARVDNK